MEVGLVILNVSSFPLYAFINMYFPRTTAFTNLTNFLKLCFHFHLAQNYKKKKKIEASTLTLMLLRTVSFNLIYLGIFWALFLLLVFIYTVVWVHTLYDFSFFGLVKVCSMVQNVVCLGECSMRTSEECAFCCCWMKESIDVNYTQLVMVLLS